MTYDANNAYGAGANQPGFGIGPGSDLDGATSPDDLSRPLYGATFGQAIRRYFKKFTVFSGRASRSEYWFAYLFTALLALIPSILIGVGGAMAATSATTMTYDSTSMATPEPSGPGLALVIVGYALLAIVSLALIVPTLAVSWRRLHDANFPGPFWFLTFVPFVGSIIIIVLMVMPSKPEGRRFDA